MYTQLAQNRTRLAERAHESLARTLQATIEAAAGALAALEAGKHDEVGYWLTDATEYLRDAQAYHAYLGYCGNRIEPRDTSEPAETLTMARGANG